MSRSFKQKKGCTEASKKDWTWRMKYALHFLDKNLELSASHRTAVFKAIFNEEVSAWVVTDDRLQYLIRTQLSEGRQQRMKVWQDIYRPAITSADTAERKAIEARIQGAMLSVTDAPAAPAPAAPTAVTRAQAVCCVTRTRFTISPASPASSSTARAMRSKDRSNPCDALQPGSAAVTPLSRRAPVGAWDPEIANGDTENFAPASKRRKTASFHVSAGPSSPCPMQRGAKRATSTSFLTSQKRPSALKVGFRQAHGTVIQWTPEKIAKAQENLPAVIEAEAHPPMDGLLFRYYIEDSKEPRNSQDGFIARKYGKARVNFNQPPPSCDKLDWEEVFYHIDRSGKAIEWPSIFVSTSNNLLWTLQKALKGLNEHAETLRIAVIDAHALDRKSVYHVLPYHRRLVKKGEFTSGSWRYAGTHEFLVHKRIPGEAIIHTFNVHDLLHFVKHDQDAYDPIIERILRLDTLTKRGDLKGKIFPQFKKDAIPLSAVVVIGVAKLTAFAGIYSNSNTEQIQAFVAEIIQGWALELKHQTPEQWSGLATSYANALFEYSHRPRSLKEEMMVKRAFLGGVFWGSSKHFNPRHLPERIRSTYKSAKEIGLEDPGRMSIDEIAALQMSLMVYEKIQQKRLPGHRTQLLLEEAISDEGFASGDEDDRQVLFSTDERNRDRDMHMTEDGEDEDQSQEAFDVGKFFTRKQSIAGVRRKHGADPTANADADDSIIYE